MCPMELRTNEGGIASLSPITAFEVRIASNDMVVLVLQYVESVEQFDSGRPKQIQTVLSPARALEIAATLKKAASLFLGANSGCAVH